MRSVDIPVEARCSLAVVGNPPVVGNLAVVGSLAVVDSLAVAGILAAVGHILAQDILALVEEHHSN